MKRSWTFVIILLTVAVLASILYQLSQHKSYKQQDCLRAVPSNAGIIIKTRNINYLKSRLIEKADFKEDIFQSTIISAALQPLKDIDSLNIIGESSIKDFTKLPMCASLHTVGKEDVKAFYIVQFSNKKEVIKLEELLNNLNPEYYSVSSRQYNGSKIYELNNSVSGNGIFLSIYSGFALLSQSELLVESSLRQLKSKEDWSAVSDFQQIKKTAGKSASINVYVNFQRISDVLKPTFLKTEHKRLAKLEKQSKWGELDVDISSDGILLNGFLSGGEDGVYSQMLNNAEPIKSNLIEVLPSKTRAYLSYSFKDGEQVYDRIGTYYKNSSETNANYTQLQSFFKQNEIDFKKEYFSQLTGKFALAYSDYDHQTIANNGCLIFEINSQSRTKAAINQILEKITANGQKVYRTYRPDGELTFDIYKGFPNDILKTQFDSFLPKVPQKYYTFYKDYIVFADATKTLEQFVYTNMLKETLGNSNVHQDYLENFSMRDNVFLYCETGHLTTFFENSMSPLFAQLKTEQKEALNNFYAIGCQLSGTGSMMYSTLYLQHLPTRASEPRTIWQSLLDSTAILKPALVKNHYSKEREVIVQDASNNLYLLSNSGRVLWKKPLNEPILGAIEQVDFYKNNKLQYLFNTRNKLFLLDRNGNHVANFPVNLPSPATNPVAVVDYDKNKDYRFFISCENKKVYLYNEKGNIVPGWKFKGSEGVVNQRIQHFRSNNKDYIAFSDHVNNYILDRRGNIRVPVKTAFSRNKNSVFFLEGKNTSKDALVTSSSKGEIVKIQLASGDVDINSIGEIDSNHRLNCFVKNGKINYLLSQEKELRLYNNQLKPIFKKEFENNIDLNVDVYHFSANNIKFGISQPEHEQIHLLNYDGKSYVGFPLRGKSRFSIGFLKSSSSKFNLIVAGSNNYLYNYRVE
ncbi:DUF3352 domain-containing protein [Carboxylicivirga sp. N1Y90]|uniref:DUF3352 domain-containing protein n=1 Tax=Carboxylicivirga fragile TaxID=3417571 RepID=UPI003D32B802|nr:DUF3352 domain-containing protein [Marinilabiliaceae bacterium N1Y90]